MSGSQTLNSGDDNDDDDAYKLHELGRIVQYEIWGCVPNHKWWSNVRISMSEYTHVISLAFHKFAQFYAWLFRDGSIRRYKISVYIYITLTLTEFWIGCPAWRNRFPGLVRPRSRLRTPPLPRCCTSGWATCSIRPSSWLGSPASSDGFDFRSSVSEPATNQYTPIVKQNIFIRWLPIC